MAEKIGTSRRHYIRIENGQHRPGRVLLAAIVRETGAEDLAGDEDDEEAASLREDYLVFADLMDRINARREQKEMTA
jgi:transcriptional regulator with XRE-family HTH domain